MEEKNARGSLGRSQKTGKKAFPNHHMKKRNISKLPKRDNDIYVTTKTSLQCQLSRCMKLFDEGQSEIVIHGLGAAINTAVNLSLILQEKLSHTVDIAVNTSTVDLLDDFLPLSDEIEPFSKKRSNSAIHIKVSRTPGFHK